MKLTKLQLKQLIKEEIESDARIVAAIENLSNESWSDVALTNAIEELASKMDDLDLSIDFLSAALLGVDPQAVSGAQSGVGRGARATKAFNVEKSVDEAYSEEHT